MRKWLSILLAAMMLFAVLPSAMAENAAPAEHKSSALFPKTEYGYPDLGGITLTIWMPFNDDFTDIATSYSEFAVVKNLEKYMNVNLEFAHPPIGQEKENFALMMTNAKLPDMIFQGGIESYYAGGVTMAYEDGVLYDYTSLISEENTPNYWEKVVSDPYLAKGIIDDYGRNYRLGAQISGSAESCTCMWGMMIRKDILEQIGMDVPETIDEWTAMLKAMKEAGVQYPLILNKSNYWQSRNAFSCAWNVDARSFFITEEGTVAYGPTTPEYKEYLSVMRDWYLNGYINADFMNTSQTDSWSMMANGQGGAIVDHTWPYPANYYAIVEEADPSKALVAAQMPKLNKEDPLTRVMVTNRGISSTQAKYITADTEYPEACVAFLDALYDTDIEFMLSNGIEGIGYTLNEAGYPVIATMTQDNTKEERLSMRIYEMETESDSDLEYIITSKYCYGVQPDTIRNFVQCSYDGEWPFGCTFTTEEAEVLSKYKADVETYRDEMVQKFITGNASLDEFDSFVAKLNEMGLSEMQKVYEASYARYMAR